MFLIEVLNSIGHNHVFFMISLKIYLRKKEK